MKVSAKNGKRFKPESFEAWYRRRHPEFIIAPYQLTYIHRLEKLARREGRKKLACLLPPGDGKSTIGTLEFVPWYMSQFPDHAVATISYADSVSKRFGGKIKANVADESAKRYPALSITRDSRSKTYFVTAAGGEFFSFGFDGQINASRLDLVDIDDPVKHMTEANSEAVMTQRWDIYRSVIRNRWKPGGICVMNLTRQGLRDFYARVLEAEPDEWDVLCFPAQNQDGSYLWEEYHGADHYEKARRDDETWWCQWMQEPRAFISQTFSPNWLCFYDRGEPGSKTDVYRYPTYMICDAGRGLGGSGENRTSIPVFAAGPERRVFLVDWVLDRLNPRDRADAIVRLTRKWKPLRIIYEEIGFVSDSYWLNERFTQENIEQRVIPVGRRGSRGRLTKGQRIEQLADWFKEGRIWLPKKLIYKQMDGHTVDLIKYFIEQEYLPWRGQDTIPYDDALDSFSRLNDQEELRLEFLDGPIEAQASDDNYPSYVGRGSWESIW